jgi:hypothetical protein
VRRETAAYGVRVSAIAIKGHHSPRRHPRHPQPGGDGGEAGEGNLVRHREETAATRSLLNTAKLIEDKPLLVRLKELERLEKVAEKVETINVFGALEGLLDSHHQAEVGWGHALPTLTPPYPRSSSGVKPTSRPRITSSGYSTSAILNNHENNRGSDRR